MNENKKIGEEVRRKENVREELEREKRDLEQQLHKMEKTFNTQ